MIIALQVVGGLVLLYFGGEHLVRGAVELAHRSGVSPLVIGLTVIACGTSAPELVVCLIAALDGAPGIAVGNVVGSNIANILLVLGAAALVYPITHRLHSLRRDGVVAIGATVLFVAVCLTGTLRLWHGLVMLFFLGAFLFQSYWTDRRNRAVATAHEKEIAELEKAHEAGWIMLVRIFGGLAGLLIGSELLVDGSVAVARSVGVSDTVIGITLVAVGTSLPELATAMIAATHRHTDVALGSVLGSNIFNLLGIMGVVAVVTPVSVPPEIAAFDIWVLLAVTVGFILLGLAVRRIGRPLSLLFLMAYAAYIVLQFSGLTGLAAPAA